jgi:carboxylesterase type B
VAVVKTVEGSVQGIDADGVVAFRGIPFAAAPEGELRFQPPAPVAAWEGVRDAVAYGAAPPQVSPMPGVPSIWRPEDGLDCLSLNVWSPDLGAAGLPVMVWIYGGAWKLGSSSMPHYDGATLARSGVVVVTLNYRVGFEGFGHLPGVPDNRGLRDQIAGLEWVRRNIAGFGGDPDNVTVFGQSAGAGSVVLLTVAPAAQGLFRRAIAQSFPAGLRSVDGATEVTRIIAEAAGVPPTHEGLAGLAPEAILAVQDAPLAGSKSGITAFGPVVDGDLVTGPPQAALRAGTARDVDLICGFTEDEWRLFAEGVDLSEVDLAAVAGTLPIGEGAAAAYRDAYPDATDRQLFLAMMSDAVFRMPSTWVAEAHAAGGGRTWLYEFAWKSPMLGACHGIDVPFVFGDGDNRYSVRFLGSRSADGFAELSGRMRTAWTSFAATGDPGWPRFDALHRRTRIWDTTPVDAAYPLAESYRIWEQAAPRG